MRNLIILACFALTIAAIIWPAHRQPLADITGDGSATAPSVTWSDTSILAPRAGVYLVNGRPRFVVRGVVVAETEFRTAVTDEEWNKVQEWISERR